MQRLSCERKSAVGLHDWHVESQHINSSDYTLHMMAHTCANILAVPSRWADDSRLENFNTLPNPRQNSSVKKVVCCKVVTFCSFQWTTTLCSAFKLFKMHWLLLAYEAAGRCRLPGSMWALTVTMFEQTTLSSSEREEQASWALPVNLLCNKIAHTSLGQCKSIAMSSNTPEYDQLHCHGKSEPKKHVVMSNATD